MISDYVNGRCGWCGDDVQYVKYHDEEWGRLVTDDCLLFEFLVLESAQAGLSWLCVLRKREGYRRAFHGFDAVQVSQMTDTDVDRLMQCNDIVRNRLKIKATISNAQCFLSVVEEFGSFDKYIRSFFPCEVPVDRHPETLQDIPTHDDVSDAMSKDMRRRGFKFFGTTICYAFLQATGYINDHLDSCISRK